MRVPAGIWLRVAVLLYATVWAATSLLPRYPDYPKAPAVFPGAAVLEGWFRYDGNWYELIVRDGYRFGGLGQQANVAFFPAYPLAMKAVTAVVRDPVLAGILTTFLCGLAASIGIYHWTRGRLGERVARRTVIVLATYPYAFYLFGAVYADALFVLAVVTAFLLVEHDRPVAAGLAAAVATAARPVGLAVVVGLVAITLARRDAFSLRPWRLELRRLRPADAGVLLGLVGFGLWALYLDSRFGDPLLFAKIQGAPGWDQGDGPRTWFKVALVNQWRMVPQWIGDTLQPPPGLPGYSPWSSLVYTAGITFQALLVLGAFLLVPRIWRRIGWGYAVYVVAVMGIPLLGSKDFQGTGRYLLAAIPCFAVVGQWIEEGGDERRWRRAIPWASLALLVFITTGYARGYYVA